MERDPADGCSRNPLAGTGLTVGNSLNFYISLWIKWNFPRAGGEGCKGPSLGGLLTSDRAALLGNAHTVQCFHSLWLRIDLFF